MLYQKLFQEVDNVSVCRVLLVLCGNAEVLLAAGRVDLDRHLLGAGSLGDGVRLWLFCDGRDCRDLLGRDFNVSTGSWIAEAGVGD